MTRGFSITLREMFTQAWQTKLIRKIRDARTEVIIQVCSSGHPFINKWADSQAPNREFIRTFICWRLNSFRGKAVFLHERSLFNQSTCR